MNSRLTSEEASAEPVAGIVASHTIQPADRSPSELISGRCGFRPQASTANGEAGRSIESVITTA
jgi:hypothetical protein